ncbi:MAG: hypothetical protein FJW26_08200 [Acidimicrobiia bacterium]|nr:hypothetical protein [Acidimicrobiia bacterium]
MTPRERMFAAIRGLPSDQIPWAPRMDLWCIALRARGTLPHEFQGLNLDGIADVLGVGCHAVRGDYTLKRDPVEFALRGYGLENHVDFPFRLEVQGLDVDFECDGQNYRTSIKTPAGELTTLLQLTPEMQQSGISMPFTKRYPIRSVDDLEAVGQVFEHLKVIRTPEAYSGFRNRIGERGLAAAHGPNGASPMHLILHDLMPMEQFFYFYADEKPALDRLGEKIGVLLEDILESLLACEAEVVHWGANYDQDLTPPKFFNAEIAPWLKKVSDRVHRAGKFLQTHTDGENRYLLPHYPACAFDIAESVCPHPMTSCTPAEIRKGLGPTTTVWGGIPSVALLNSSMDDGAFEAYLDKVFGELGSGEHLILGVADNVPPDANLDRLHRIRERIESFGAVQPGRGDQKARGGA